MTTKDTKDAMSCDEFYQQFFIGKEYDTILSEQKAEGEFDATWIYNHMLKKAKDLGIQLWDAKSWDYDGIFYQDYKSVPHI